MEKKGRTLVRIYMVKRTFICLLYTSSAYYNYYSYKTWGAAETYHLCIDSSVLGIDGTVQFLSLIHILRL